MSIHDISIVQFQSINSAIKSFIIRLLLFGFDLLPNYKDLFVALQMCYFVCPKCPNRKQLLGFLQIHGFVFSKHDNYN